jgi:hypothetical protein
MRLLPTLVIVITGILCLANGNYILHPDIPYKSLEKNPLNFLDIYKTRRIRKQNRWDSCNDNDSRWCLEN